MEIPDLNASVFRVTYYNILSIFKDLFFPVKYEFIMENSTAYII